MAQRISTIILEKMGFGNLLAWIIDYLTARKQKVIINGKESNLIKINAGVPQGSILGPLFSLIFINDIVLERMHDQIICTILPTLLTYPNIIKNFNLNKIQIRGLKKLVTLKQKAESMNIQRKPVILLFT